MVGSGADTLCKCLEFEKNSNRSRQFQIQLRVVQKTGQSKVPQSNTCKQVLGFEKISLRLFSYLLELRPDERNWDGFILEERQLIPTAAETWAGVSVVADAIIERQKRRISSARISGNFLFFKVFMTFSGFENSLE